MSKDSFGPLHERALEAPMSRRRLFGMGAGAVSAAMLTGAPIPGGLGRVVMAQDGGAEFHGAYPYQAPPTGHFNDFVTNAILHTGTAPQLYSEMIFQPLGMYYWATGEWLPLLATEWAFLEDGETFEIKLREGVVWSDDTPFTANDYEATLQCYRIMSGTLWSYIDEVTVVDDLTVQLHMSTPSTVVERYAIRLSNPQPASIYGEWADRAREFFGGGGTIDDPEGKQLLDQFNQFRPENVPVTGPFMIDVNSITSAQLTLVKNDKAWNAGDVLFDRIVNYNGETDTVTPLVLAEEVDYATHGFSPASEQQFIDQGLRVLRPPVYSGPALYFNYNRHGETLGDPIVRRAIAHAVDRAQNGQISLAESGVAVEYMTGMSDNLVPQWVNEEAVETLDTYPFDQEQATALLEEAGWTKDGDVWTMANGEEASFELSFPAEFADWSAAGADVAEQLTNFGIRCEPRAVTFTQHEIDVNQGNFDIAIRSWGASSSPHPHFSYRQDLLVHNTLAINDGGEGMGFDLVQTTEVAGEVDLEELVRDSALGLDEQAQIDQITTIAQVFNELLPIVPLFERYGNNAALEGVRVASWPAEDDPILKNSPYADGIPTMLMYTGELEPASGS
jgi:peptide/nickel transport system substrate-binding protein